jgi:hypothetical protein
MRSEMIIKITRLQQQYKVMPWKHLRHYQATQWILILQMHSASRGKSRESKGAVRHRPAQVVLGAFSKINAHHAYFSALPTRSCSLVASIAILLCGAKASEWPYFKDWKKLRGFQLSQLPPPESAQLRFCFQLETHLLMPSQLLFAAAHMLLLSPLFKQEADA